jgi:hypothetical protein
MANQQLLYSSCSMQSNSKLQIVDQASDLGGRYWDQTRDVFGVNPDRFCWLTRLNAVVAGSHKAR